jgi:hypothetical protein
MLQLESKQRRPIARFLLKENPQRENDGSFQPSKEKAHTFRNILPIFGHNSTFCPRSN